ncbi:MAG: hypothetical protein ABW318_12985 [Vicinamibacterales bacterium]
MRSNSASANASTFVPSEMMQATWYPAGRGLAAPISFAPLDALDLTCIATSEKSGQAGISTLRYRSAAVASRCRSARGMSKSRESKAGPETGWNVVCDLGKAPGSGLCFVVTRHLSPLGLSGLGKREAMIAWYGVRLRKTFV